MSILTVSPFAEKKIKQGKQLLLAEDFPNITENNQLVYLYSQSKDFLGTGYLSSQNKGIGWFLSPNKEKLTVTYFQGLFERAKAKRQSYYDNELTTAFRLSTKMVTILVVSQLIYMGIMPSFHGTMPLFIP